MSTTASVAIRWREPVTLPCIEIEGVWWCRSCRRSQRLARSRKPSWESCLSGDLPALRFEPRSFNDPLFILYSSGTTGVPKCIVHGIGGTLIQHAKEHALHTDISRDDRFFYFTTCGWMMWNWLVSGSARGAADPLRWFPLRP
ncbi:MAG: hypothetical protein CM15mP103_12780 [Gammaproteobacteria bacterium]|nr:MAG: hypothetical protein CM15mP103_12780 [Gammaproteobacteria bacterium]